MALEFERGIAALQSSGGGGGSSRNFTPFIKWEDGEEKYVAILNKVEEIPKIFVHEFIKVDEGERQDGTTYPVYAEFLDRTEPPIGEDEDPLTEKGSQSRERNLAVAVQLEPIMGKGRNGRMRPEGFEVKTTEFKRRVFDDDGEETGEKEDVVAPVIGFIMQSGSNFFGYLGEYNESDGPHENIPFRIKRAGGDKNTQYHWKPFEDQELDLSNVVDNIDGISYIRRDLDEIVGEITEKELDDSDAAHLIASKMLEARLEELADRERYDELTGDITEVKSKFGGKKDGKGGSRGNRKSQSARKSAPKDDPEPESDTPDENPSASDNSESSEDRLAQFKRLRQKSDRNRKNDGDDD
jgi:hypothetical protein